MDDEWDERDKYRALHRADAYWTQYQQMLYGDADGYLATLNRDSDERPLARVLPFDPNRRRRSR